MGPLIRPDKSVVSNDKEMAEDLNKYFASVFTRENIENVPEAKQRNSGNEPLEDVKFEPYMVEAELKKLNPTKAPGPDGIWAVTLHNLTTELSEPLSRIYNKSMQEEEVPRDWRDAMVAPAHKSGSKGSVSHYSP